MMMFFLGIVAICLSCVVAGEENKIASGSRGIDILDGLCLDGRSDRLVYRHKNDTHVYVAFDVLKTGKVHVFMWKIIRLELLAKSVPVNVKTRIWDQHHFETAHAATFISTDLVESLVYAVDFRTGVHRDHIIGATSRKHMEKFKHRVERKMKHCKRMLKETNKRCKLTAIHSLFVRLKIRRVNFDNVEGCDT